MAGNDGPEQAGCDDIDGAQLRTLVWLTRDDICSRRLLGSARRAHAQYPALGTARLSGCLMQPSAAPLERLCELRAVLLLTPTVAAACARAAVERGYHQKL